ncbi:MAG TPA: hypothetical protein VIK18_03460 [Pirellulales bacterium]
MSDDATPIVIELAKGFISLVREIRPDWRKAYLRFSGWSSVSETKASYVHPAGVEIIDVTKHKEFFHNASRRGRELLAALGKDEGLFLLTADSNFDYEIEFEYAAKDRWRISKLAGGTGIPDGF